MHDEKNESLSTKLREVVFHVDLKRDNKSVLIISAQGIQ